jgi:hypothetical protein
VVVPVIGTPHVPKIMTADLIFARLIMTSIDRARPGGLSDAWNGLRRWKTRSQLLTGSKMWQTYVFNTKKERPLLIKTTERIPTMIHPTGNSYTFTIRQDTPRLFYHALNGRKQMLTCRQGSGADYISLYRQRHCHWPPLFGEAVAATDGAPRPHVYTSLLPPRARHRRAIDRRAQRIAN